MIDLTTWLVQVETKRRIQRDESDSDEDVISARTRDPALDGKEHREQVRKNFAQLFEGPFNIGRMCVECRFCDAMLWVCECNQVSAMTDTRPQTQHVFRWTVYQWSPISYHNLMIVDTAQQMGSQQK